MKKKLNDIISFPSSPHFEPLSDEIDEIDEEVSQQAIEALEEKISEALDHYLALTGEPITAAISFVNNVAEMIELIDGMSGTSRPIIITPQQHQQQEDEEEI